MMLSLKPNGTAAWQQLFRHLPQATYVFNIRERVYSFINESFCERLGLAVPDALQQNGHLFYNHIHPADQKNLLQHFTLFQSAADGEVREVSYRIKRADGTWYTQTAQETVYTRDAAGAVQEIIGIVAEKNPASSPLHQNEVLSPLHISPYLSQDLAKSLDRISTYNRLIAEREALPDAVLEYSRRLQAVVSSVSQTLQQAAQFSKISTDALQLQPTNLTWVAESLRQKHSKHLREIGGVIDFDILPSLMTVPEQMMFVFDELMMNAVRFRHDERKLLLHIESHMHKLEAGKEVCTIIFADNGSGFDLGEEEAIFQPFVKLHPQVQHSGSGVGLTFCRKIVERHGGTLTATTVPDAGSSFFLTLPWQVA